MTMPKRIWADWEETYGSVEKGTWADMIRHSKQQHEYIRADVHRADVEAAVKLALEAAVAHARECIDAHAEHDAQLCCDGRMCGCQGASVHDHMKHFIRAIAADPEALAKIVEGLE